MGRAVYPFADGAIKRIPASPKGLGGAARTDQAPGRPLDSASPQGDGRGRRSEYWTIRKGSE